MTSFLDRLLALTASVSDFMWSVYWMIPLLVITGLIYTWLTRGVQVRKLVESIRLTFSGRKDEDSGVGDITPFAALMTALAATVGNGNIAGVASAIATGGPGAPFWMWVAGLIGMATKYGEGFLGVRFRKVAEDGSMAGGPMWYCRRGIQWPPAAKFLGAAFAVCGGLTALIGTGNMAQSNSMALALNSAYGIPFWGTGIGLSLLTGAVIIGGIKRIGAVTEKLVPAMILFYFGGAAVILAVKFTEIPAAFALIFKSALTPEAVGGGLVGISVWQAISLGVRRGVLSNESGLGSAAIAQAASKSNDPSRNGLIAMTGTFIDTILVNTLTTLCIVLTGAFQYTDAWRGTMAVSPDTAVTAEASLMVDSISENSLAYSEVGLRVGDRIVRWNDEPIGDLQEASRRSLSGDGSESVRLTVLRDGASVELSGQQYQIPIGNNLTSTALTSHAFNDVLTVGNFRLGGSIIALASLLFGYSTLLGWAYYGEQCFEYLGGLRVVKGYRVIYLVLLLVGALIQGAHINIVWFIGDIFNALMAIPNLVGMLFLAGYVGRFTRNYDRDPAGTLAAMRREG